MSDANEPELLQLSLQYEPETSNKVKQHWYVTFSRQRKISVYGKRIMARVLEQIKDDDLVLREFYQLRVSSILEDTGMDTSSAHVFAKKALYELAAVQWEFEDVVTKEWYLRPLLDGTKDRRIGIKDGIITIILNPKLAPYFVDIAGQYSTYKLDGYMGLHSWYSMRFFEILSAFRDKGWWEVSIEEYRQLMDCGPELDKFGQIKKDKVGKVKMKLANTADLINQTIPGPQKELQTTPYAFSYHPLFDEVPRRGRPKIIGLRFELHHKLLTVIPATWLEDKDAGRVIASLREFRVTDKNICLYLKPLGLAGGRKLVKEWQVKEGSQRKIDDKVKYCNAAFVRQGKLAIEAQRAEALQARQHVQQALFPAKALEKIAHK